MERLVEGDGVGRGSFKMEKRRRLGMTGKRLKLGGNR